MCTYTYKIYNTYIYKKIPIIYIFSPSTPPPNHKISQLRTWQINVRSLI